MSNEQNAASADDLRGYLLQWVSFYENSAKSEVSASDKQDLINAAASFKACADELRRLRSERDLAVSHADSLREQLRILAAENLGLRERVAELQDALQDLSESMHAAGITGPLLKTADAVLAKDGA